MRLTELCQVPVAFSFGVEHALSHFYVGRNQQLLTRLQQFLLQDSPDCLYIWGPSACGKTHLLSAFAQLARQQGMATHYTAALELSEASLLFDSRLFDLIMIDDLDSLKGNALAEERLFHFYNHCHLYNHCQQRRIKLIFAAQASPHAVHLSLADLLSRLRSAEAYRLQPLDDIEKQYALQHRAELRGLLLSDEVCLYILNHGKRSFAEIMLLLDKIDQASLAAKRRPTLPFIKNLFGW